MNLTDIKLQKSPLGKTNSYEYIYNPNLLFALPRALKRSEINLPDPVPFVGCDIWQAYEISWLGPDEKPIVALGRFSFPHDTPNIIESKSFKLYLYSFNNSVFDSKQSVKRIMKRDLSEAADGEVCVDLIPLENFKPTTTKSFNGYCLDNLDIEVSDYTINSKILEVSEGFTNETLYSDLLKSNCLVTGQPDWGSISISYQGKPIRRESLLRYIISFRNHNEFHEQCVERVFNDILSQCQPSKLTVEARYTRRGGLDINPFRSTHQRGPLTEYRLFRQ